MNDGGYSRIEKDFLGNERMVHYDGSGNMIGASDVVREPDGTIRIPNEMGEVATSPKPTTDPTAHIPNDAGKSMAQGTKPMPVGQTATYVIATFIGAAVLTWAIMSFKNSHSKTEGAFDHFPTTTTSPQTSQAPPPRNEPMPERDDNQFPADPKPRNDEDPSDAKPYDQTAPDMNSGDNDHPKIEPNNSDDGKSSITKSDSGDDSGKPKDDGSNPIDLRGNGDDGSKNAPDNDPNDIH